MAKVRLTSVQLEFLRDAAEERGRVAYDGRDERTGRILAARGFVRIPEIFGYSTHSVTAAHITDAGRDALRALRPRDAEAAK